MPRGQWLIFMKWYLVKRSWKKRKTGRTTAAAVKHYAHYRQVVMYTSQKKSQVETQAEYEFRYRCHWVIAPQKQARCVFGQPRGSWGVFLLDFKPYLFWLQMEQIYPFSAIALL